MGDNKDVKNFSKKLVTSLKRSPNSKLLKEYKKTFSNLSNIQ
jgi:hypothetical protein